MGKDKPIIVDTFMERGFLKSISDDHRMVYVFGEEELVRGGYFNRNHLRGLETIFPRLSEPERARRETLDTVVSASNHYLRQAQQHGIQHFIRDSETRKEDLLERIEKHFHLV